MRLPPGIPTFRVMYSFHSTLVSKPAYDKFSGLVIEEFDFKHFFLQMSKIDAHVYTVIGVLLLRCLALPRYRWFYRMPPYTHPSEAGSHAPAAAAWDINTR